MPSDRISLRIPDHLRQVADLDAGDLASPSARIAGILDRYGLLMARSTPQLTRAEWCLILDAINGWASAYEPAELAASGIAAEVADHVKLNGADDKWGLSRAQAMGLAHRIHEMHPAEQLAIVDRAERFWRRCQLDTDEAMTAAGIHPSAEAEAHKQGEAP